MESVGVGKRVEMAEWRLEYKRQNTKKARERKQGQRRKTIAIGLALKKQRLKYAHLWPVP